MLYNNSTAHKRKLRKLRREKRHVALTVKSSQSSHSRELPKALTSNCGARRNDGWQRSQALSLPSLITLQTLCWLHKDHSHPLRRREYLLTASRKVEDAPPARHLGGRGTPYMASGETEGQRGFSEVQRPSRPASYRGTLPHGCRARE